MPPRSRDDDDASAPSPDDADAALKPIAGWTVPSVDDDGVAGFLDALVDSRP